jgi:glycosyltransferase involved in cell wall biosynthesis
MVRHAAQANPRILFAGLISGKQIADYTCAGDVVYYGFDPQNPNARFSAPNKLYEALAAGRPLITGDFGEIAEVVRTAECGIVLHRYDATEIRAALIAMEDPEVRRNYTENAQRFGSSFMNWTQGEEVLFTEYSALLGWPAVTGEPAVARTITARAGAR